MIAIVIPAHNEAERIGSCVAAAKLAGAHPDLLGEPVEVLVVLDDCADATGELAAASGVRTLHVEARNVGMARAAGATEMLASGARWLAFTDADTLVSPDWVVRQLALDADVVCGTIAVHDWSLHLDNEALLREHFAQTYTDAEGHRHIHGANLGVCAIAYQKAGGFASLSCNEELALVASLQASGARIAWSAAPRVTTSARTDARARGGFGDTLVDVLCDLQSRTARSTEAHGLD